MREDWDKILLGDVVTIQTGKYDANHAKTNGKYRFYTCAFDYLMCDTNRFSGKSIILPGNGANVGEVFYYEGEFDAYQRTYILNELKINAKYIFYHLKGFWKSKNSDKQFGTATNYIRMGNFTDYSLSFPSFPEQHAIVAKIEELFSDLDQGIADLKKAQDQLKVYRQAVLKKAFEGELTKENLELEIIKLGSVIDKPRYGTSKKCYLEPKGIAVLRIPNIGKGHINPEELKYAEFDAKEISTLKLQEGDILTIRSNGSVDLVGKCALITKNDIDYLYAGYLIRLRPDKEKIDSKFLLYSLKSHELRVQIESKAKSTSGVNNINSGELASLEIPYFKLETQHEIVKEIESRLSVCDKVEESVTESLEKAKALRQSILKKAFEGELLSEEELAKCKAALDYEPASVLLERIKKEKQKK